VLNGLQPLNGPQLLAAFSSSSSSAKVLQKIRNVAAHHNAQTMTEIDALKSAYIVFPINHPTHAMFWTNPNSGDFLITDAIDDLKDAGEAAIS